MDNEPHIPEPQTDGALVPPPRWPPTAIATDTPEPNPAPRPSVRRVPKFRPFTMIADLVDGVLELVQKALRR